MIADRCAVILLAAGVACSGSAPTPGSDAAPVITRIDTSDVLLRTGQGLGDPTRVVIRDSVAWEQFWSQAHALLEPAPTAPVVDFADSMLLAAALGTRATGGHRVTIDSVSRGGVLRAFVTTITPGPGCVTTMAITWPVQVVRVERFDGSVEFVEAERTEQCK